MTVAGDTQEIEKGDLVTVPPATDHSIANGGDSELCCVSAQSPPKRSQVFGRPAAGVVGDYDDDDEY